MYKTRIKVGIRTATYMYSLNIRSNDHNVCDGDVFS